MNIRYFQKRGIWHLDFLADGKRLRPSTGCRSEAEAKKAAALVMAEAIAKAQQGPFSNPNSPTVSTFAGSGATTLREAYSKAQKVREQWIKAKDKKTLEATFDAIAASKVGKTQLSEDSPMGLFTRDFVRDLRAAWLTEKGKRKGTTLSASTINHRLSMLSVLLEVCELPPHTVKHLSTKGNARTRRVTDEEIRRGQSWLLAHAQQHKGAVDMVDLITLGLELGARQGELLDVPWTNVAAGHIKFDDTKNHSSRTVPLTEVAKRVLEGRRHVRGGPFKCFDQDRVTALWDLMRAGIGLQDDEEFVFHSLRHECLSRLGDSGANTLIIKAIAGHASVATTERYVHSSLSAMAQAQEMARRPAAADPVH